MSGSEGTENAKPKGGSRLSSILLGVRECCFSIDIYGYTPNLIVSEFKTFISLIVSFIILTAFSLAVIYTTYIWVVGNLNQTESDEVHDESIKMLLGSDLQTFGEMPLPQLGVLLLLGNGTFVSWAEMSSSFKISFQQSTVCNSDASNKAQDILSQAACSFQDTSNIANPHVTRCADWDASSISLRAMNNTASNPCKVGLEPDQSYSVPRVVGTFYNMEYSYITATVSINSSFLGNTSFVNNVAKGSMQVFISFNYSKSSNFAQGIIVPKISRVWSRRINLFPNVTIKAEVLMRPRLSTIHNYWWDVPSLQKDILDYLPWNVESYISLPGSVAAGWTDVGKVFMRFDDRDEMMDLFPPQDALAVVSGWGGFLSILLVVGTPAVVINRLIFQEKVKKLISEDKITFDEDVRTHRSQAVTKSYVQGGGKSIMTKTRSKSVLGFLSSANQIQLPFLTQNTSMPTPSLKEDPPRTSTSCLKEGTPRTSTTSLKEGTPRTSTSCLKEGTPRTSTSCLKEGTPRTSTSCLKEDPPRTSPKEGRKVRLSFVNQEMSHSSPGLHLQPQHAAGGGSASPAHSAPQQFIPPLHHLQHSVSFPNAPSEPPTSFSAGLFRSGKVHAAPGPAPAAAAGLSPAPSASRAVPADEPLFAPMPASDDTAPIAPSAASAGAAPAAAGAGEAPPLAPGAGVHTVSLFGPAAGSSVAASCASGSDDTAMLGPGPAGDSAFFQPGTYTDHARTAGLVADAAAGSADPDRPSGFVPPVEPRSSGAAAALAALLHACPQPVGESLETLRHSNGRSQQWGASRQLAEEEARDLMEQGCGPRPSTSRQRLLAARPPGCASCFPPSAAASRRAGPWSPGSHGGRGVCEQDEHVRWGEELSARLQATTFKYEDTAEKAPLMDHQVASMAVKYDGDCFADDDEDENYEDVVRHATSECNALFHLRQVVKLVQRDSPFLTLWGDHLTVHQQEVVQRKQDRSVHRGAGSRTSNQAGSHQGSHTGGKGQHGAVITQDSMLESYGPTPQQQPDPGFLTSVSLWQEDRNSTVPDMEAQRREPEAAGSTGPGRKSNEIKCLNP